MFTQTGEYALRVMVFLADQSDKPQITQQIGDATRVPLGYLAKVLQTLGKAGLVKSQRGLHGGFVLTRPASDISLLDVLEAVDPIARITTCPLGLAAHGTRLCPLHKKLDGALALVEETLRRSTLAELLAEPTTSKPLCDIRSGKVTPMTVSAKRGRKKAPSAARLGA